jgi:hypothetical protein
MPQFMRVKADAAEGLLEKYAANVDYGSEEMIVARANSLNEWLRANCQGIAWVELVKHVEYRPLEGSGFTPDDVDWELYALFNDPEDAARFRATHNVVDKFTE